MKNKVAKRVISVAIAVVTVLANLSLIPLEVYADEVDETQYAKDFYSINSIDDIRQYFYKDGVTYQSLSTKTGHGSIEFLSDHIAMRFNCDGENSAGEGNNNIVATASAVNFTGWGRMCFDVNRTETDNDALNMVNSFSSSGINPGLNFVEIGGRNLDGTLTETRSVTNGMSPNCVVAAVQGHLSAPAAFALAGSQVYIDIYKIYLERAGVLVNINPDGGTYNGNSGITKMFANQTDSFFQQHGLELDIPVKDNYVFCGWQVDSTEHLTTADEDATLPKVDFNEEKTSAFISYFGQENFTLVEVTLKPIWKVNGNSIVKVNRANGSSIETLNGNYLETVRLDVPTCDGYDINFVLNNANASCDTTSIKTTKTFNEWQKSSPSYCKIDATVLTFLGYDDLSTTLTAKYIDNTITLPTPTTTNKQLMFGGWYTKQYAISEYESIDSDYYVGAGGSNVSFTSNKTLYAVWIPLDLKSELISYDTNGTRVDRLYWNTLLADSSIVYRPYYKLASDTLWQVKEPYGTNVASSKTTKSFSAGQSGTFIAPATTYYDIVVKGGNGGGAGGGNGGYGGYVTAKVYLTRGTTLYIDAGANGSTAAGASQAWASGGGNGAGIGLGYMQVCGGGGQDNSKYNLTVRHWYGSTYSEENWHDPQYCPDPNHWDGDGDLFRCSNCRCPHSCQCIWGSGPYKGYGTGYCTSSGAYNAQRAWMGRHKQINLSAGGGGGASTIQLNDASGTYVLCAGGGAGSSSGGSGASVTGTYYSASQWRLTGSPINSGTPGRGGAGGGGGYISGYPTAGYNLIDSSPISIISSASTYSSSAAYVNITYYDYNTNNNSMMVGSSDLASPSDPENIAITGLNDDNDTTIVWSESIDYGTLYDYKIEMSYKDTYTNLQESNIIQLESLSDIKGYAYIIDIATSTEISKATATTLSTSTNVKNSKGFTKTTDIAVTPSLTTIRYLHVVAMDKAGNISNTVHFKIPTSVIITYNINDTTVNRYGDPCTSVGVRGVGSKIAQEIPAGMSGNIYTNITTTLFTKKGYQFLNWNTKADGTGTTYLEDELVEYIQLLSRHGQTITLYAQWEPIRYDIRFNGNNNWNDQDAYLQEKIRYDQSINLIENKFTRPDDTNSKPSGTHYDGGYQFIGWGYTNNQEVPDFLDKGIINNLSFTEAEVVDLYALWKKDMKLIFNMNTGKYQGKTGGVELSGTVYNNQMTYEYTVNNGLTVEKLPYYTEQINKIDAYGTYDANGLNAKYTKYVDGVSYRFIGWSLNKNATTPDWELSPYNSARKNTISIPDNTTLYAIWEPMLQLDVVLNRTLGNKYTDLIPNTVSATNTINNSATEPQIAIVARSGEQCNYLLKALGNSEQVDVTFDNRMTAIYTNVGAWTDKLNVDYSGNCNLNKAVPLNNGNTVNIVNNRFYIPQYLGTDKSEPNSIGVNLYSVLFHLSGRSYFSEKVNGNPIEDINVLGNIYVTHGSDSGEPDITETVLNDLRTKLRIKIKLETEAETE